MALSTLQKKQIVGVTGLVMVGFVLAHLSGNFLIFKGAESYNGYAEFLESLGALLWVARIGLIVSFVLHMAFTINLVIINRKARNSRYYAYQNHRNESSLATRLMPLTGTVIFLYIVFHLLDFTFADKSGIPDGLFGLVVKTLGSPIHSMMYIVAMVCVGLHMFHAFQSVFQTFGVMSANNQVAITRVSRALGVLVAIAFSSIPLYILITF
jgi:succinate dehydrogenase / fumarate reductase cytochrome b subunit